jgi:hypothetical protein
VQASDMGEEESFKITDRRGRDPDADRVGQFRAGEAASPSSAPGATPPAPARDQSPEIHASAPTLEGLIMMFATSALINLGDADPMDGEGRVDLARAREAIDVLLLLRDKTAGNRTDQESRLLDEVLYDLQMRFVRVVEDQRSR